MIFDLQYTLRCSAPGCQGTSIQRFQIARHQQSPWLSVPMEWTKVEGQVYCPKHKIEVQISIDGEVRRAR